MKHMLYLKEINVRYSYAYSWSWRQHRYLVTLPALKIKVLTKCKKL